MGGPLQQLAAVRHSKRTIIETHNVITIRRYSLQQRVAFAFGLRPRDLGSVNFKILRNFGALSVDRSRSTQVSSCAYSVTATPVGPGSLSTTITNEKGTITVHPGYDHGGFIALQRDPFEFVSVQTYSGPDRQAIGSIGAEIFGQVKLGEGLVPSELLSAFPENRHKRYAF